jgi:predicted dienelactone hydrolase
MRSRRALAAAALAAIAASAPSVVLATTGGAGAPGKAPAAGPAVGLRVLRLVDRSRLARPERGRPFPRALTVVLRYPATGSAGEDDSFDAPAARGAGALPLIVFAHGFDVTPATYSRLLRAWARAGYVVAAPVFPLESSTAPGGPDEADLVNEPADISYVISRLLAATAAPGGPLAGVIDPARIAVAGQSDGGIAALAAAYALRTHDPRIKAAVVLSGAELSGFGGYPFHAGEPPLLAVQGTADTTNAPRNTYAYFDGAARPKYLLRLLGAGHLPPYTTETAQLALVERTTLAFLGSYLGGAPGAPARIAAAAANTPLASLTSRP